MRKLFSLLMIFGLSWSLVGCETSGPAPVESDVEVDDGLSEMEGLGDMPDMEGQEVDDDTAGDGTPDAEEAP